MGRETYEVKYKSGCVVVEVGKGRMEICRNGEVWNSIGEGVYSVSGLYKSFCEYFQANMPMDLRVDLLDRGDFVVSGEWLTVSRDGNKLVIGVGKDVEVEVLEKGINVWCGGVELQERGWINLGGFINSAFAGEIYQNAVLLVDGDELVFKTKWGEFLRVGKKGVMMPRDFCLVFGKIRNSEVIYDWISKVAKEMVYKGQGKGELGVDVYVFKWGFWKIGFTVDGRLHKIRLVDKGLKIEVTDTMIWIRRIGERKQIELEEFFEKKDKISEICIENNRFLRNLFF